MHTHIATTALFMGAGLVLGVGTGLAFAGEITPPAGLYCSCPPTTGNGNGSVIPEVAQLDHVDGVLVRLEWGTLEPSPGVYDWSLLDEQIARAELYGIKVSLAVVNGSAAPSWLSAMGVEMFSFQFGSDTREMPVPWDSTFQSRWTQFIAALGARYANEDTISLVYATNSSRNGFEMQLPFSPTDQINWQAAGYSDALYADSWKTAIDAFVGAFPNHPVSHEVHPVLGSDDVANDVYQHARDTHAETVGVLAAWWMVHNALDVYPGMFEILKDASLASHSQVQVANSYTNTPDRFSNEGYQGEIDLAIESGVRYMEVWNSDLLNASLTDLMIETSARLNTPFCNFADLDQNGYLDFFDVSAFLGAFTAHDQTADYTGDGAFDFFDVSTFLSMYNGGCP